ncbi:hypothetical protein NQD34_006756 [Periophthalmus magnuspinnatus]|nr:hypothetical protein NQD34_006756 [Periophthalmus magnuspinnatus]
MGSRCVTCLVAVTWTSCCTTHFVLVSLFLFQYFDSWTEYSLFKMSDVTYLTLPTWIGGSLNIRFIYLVNSTSFRLTECPYKGPAIPLYLGADLFSNTGIRTENHPRHHAKFAKKGLATKLHFSSVYRFHGLKVPTSNNSLWFYSVQGLFRIAFEFYSKQDQLSLLENFQTVGLLLDLIDSYITDNLNEHNVTEAVMVLLQAKQWDEVYSSCLLSCIGRWLGQQFHKANSSISQKVEGFKLHHIDRINDLPPAEELTQELFPEAMRSLLLHWMGLSEEASVDKRHSECPILLLILEFANHNLITGVAHVLYSSLIYK